MIIHAVLGRWYDRLAQRVGDTMAGVVLALAGVLWFALAFTDLVESALRENVEQARQRVAAKIAVARDEFARRFAEVDEATKKAVVTAIEASYTTDMYELELLECPVCGTMALASGTLKEEFDEDWDHREGVLLNVHVLVLFTPNGLSCRACHLELNGRDEMDAAGMGDAFYPARPERHANYGLSPEHDQKLTDWMRERLALAVWPKPEEYEIAPGVIETAVLQLLEPPLNLKDVVTPWTPQLKATRKAMTDQARQWSPDT